MERQNSGILQFITGPNLQRLTNFLACFPVNLSTIDRH